MSHISHVVFPYRDMYEERAGILEYDAGLSRVEAERLAYAETLVSFLKEKCPHVIYQYETALRLKTRT